MSDSNEQDAARLLRALSVGTRLQMVRLLRGRALCVGALSRILGISAGGVSQHLRILKEAGLVRADRRGNFMHYFLSEDAEERCRAALDSLFEAPHHVGGSRCLGSTARPPARIGRARGKTTK